MISEESGDNQGDVILDISIATKMTRIQFINSNLVHMMSHEVIFVHFRFQIIFLSE